MTDGVTVSIRGRRRYLWRAVDQDGDILDILVQKRKDKQAAKRFFRKLLRGVHVELIFKQLRVTGMAPGNEISTGIG